MLGRQLVDLGTQGSRPAPRRAYGGFSMGTWEEAVPAPFGRDFQAAGRQRQHKIRQQEIA